jgi:8-oxo-dGTP pyrophosphatase MutT (NUDIX family)
MTTPDLDRRRTVVERSRERAGTLLADALDAHDPDARTFDPWVIDPPRYFDDFFPESLDEQLDRWGGIAGAVVVEDGEVLCVDVGYKDRWETPGGDVECGARPEGVPRDDATARDAERPSCRASGPEAREQTATNGSRERGETMAEAAVREVKEETNLDVDLTGVFYARHVDIDYGPPDPVRIPMVVFTAKKVGGRRAVPAHKVPGGEPEIEDVRWFGPDELPEDLTDRELIREYLESHQ